MRILNLTQHVATAEQISAGVFEPKHKGEVQALITFDEMPTQVQLTEAAEQLASLAKNELRAPWPWENDGQPKEWAVMIGGAPFFMAPLERALKARGIRTLYAFSKRDSIDQVQANGSVRKTQIFRHAGFIEVAG